MRNRKTEEMVFFSMIPVKDLCVFTPLLMLMTQKIEAEGAEIMAVAVKRAKDCPATAGQLELAFINTAPWMESMPTDVPLGAIIKACAALCGDTTGPITVRCFVRCTSADLCIVPF